MSIKPLKLKKKTFICIYIIKKWCTFLLVKISTWHTLEWPAKFIEPNCSPQFYFLLYCVLVCKSNQSRRWKQSSISLPHFLFPPHPPTTTGPPRSSLLLLICLLLPQQPSAALSRLVVHISWLTFHSIHLPSRLCDAMVIRILDRLLC